MSWLLRSFQTTGEVYLPICGIHRPIENPEVLRYNSSCSSYIRWYNSTTKNYFRRKLFLQEQMSLKLDR